MFRKVLELDPGHEQATAELRALGEVLQCDEDQLCLRVPRGDVARASAKVLETYAVADLAIEEMDIGTIIERIFRERGEVRA